MKTVGKTAKQQGTKEIVLDAIIELHNQEQIVTRETLAGYIDLPLSVIDERVKILANDGLIARVQRGVYVPVVQHAVTRPISHTELPDGTVILDIGDEVLKLTPKEARTLGAMLASRAMQASTIELGHHSALAVNEVMMRIRALEKQLNPALEANA